MFLDDQTQIEWWLLLLGCMTAFVSIVFIGRHQYKKLVIYSDKIVIRPIFSIRPTTIKMDNVRGFELFETAIIGGLGYNIRLITNADKKIVFPQDSYTNYDEVINGFRKTKLAFFGQKEIQSTFKTTYGRLLKWTAVLFPIIYGLFLIIRHQK